MVSMIMAILLSFINWKLDHSTVSIKPDLISDHIGVRPHEIPIKKIKQN